MTHRLAVLPLAVAAALAAAPAAAQQPDSAFWAAQTWRSIGPANFSGRVTDVEGVPGSKTFYVASAAGGIWKTTNNGTTFRPLFQNERVVAMGGLAIAPSDSSIIWAGTGEEDSRNSISPGQGIYKPEDLRDVTRMFFSAMRERGVRSFGRRGGGPDVPPVDPGIYTVAVRIGEKTYTQPLRLIRAESFGGGDGDGVDEEAFERLIGKLLR